MLCQGGQCILVTIDSRCIYSDSGYDSGSNVTVILHGLAKALELQVLPFNRTLCQASGHLGHFVGTIGPIPQLHELL